MQRLFSGASELDFFAGAAAMSAAKNPTNGQSSPLRLVFDAGTLIVEGPEAGEDPSLPGVRFDPRTRQLRAEAIWYRSIVEHLRREKRPYVDAARAYEPAEWRLQVDEGSVSASG